MPSRTSTMRKSNADKAARRSRSVRSAAGDVGVKNLQPAVADQSPKKTSWTFLTNHAHVLLLLSQDPSMILREVAFRIGITERAVQRIIADLEEDGFIEREKIGRQNHYKILSDLPLRHPIEAHRTIGDLIGLIASKA